MEVIQMPRPMRWIWASLGAYWLSSIIHPGFFSIAIMALLMIPILIADVFFPPRVNTTVISGSEDTEKNSSDNEEAVKEQAKPA